MKIHIIYEPLEEYNLSSSIAGGDFSSRMYRVKVNKGEQVDHILSPNQGVTLENIELRQDKKNMLRFRPVAPDEAEERKKAVRSNILRGIIFVLLAIILPFMIMSFKSIRKPFNKVKFAYSDTQDYVVIVNDHGYQCGYCDKGAIDNMANTVQDVVEPADPFGQDVAAQGSGVDVVDEQDVVTMSD